jgi:hypothetical protein
VQFTSPPIAEWRKMGASSLGAAESSCHLVMDQGMKRNKCMDFVGEGINGV